MLGRTARLCDDRPVIPLVLVLTGVVALAAGTLLLRRLGPGARIGRIIAATPVVAVARAREIAIAGRSRYVGVGGRIDAEEEFLDENERPLVLRRSRLELRSPRGWTTVTSSREQKPFEIAGGIERLAVDADVLDDGLVVLTRESVGTAGEIPDLVPEGTPAGTPARLRIEILSTVDHALVLGVPVDDPERGPMLTAGLGRPLVLTTLEPAEAMRLLAHGRQGTTRMVTGLLAAGAVAIAAGVAWAVVDAVI